MLYNALNTHDILTLCVADAVSTRLPERWRGQARKVAESQFRAGKIPGYSRVFMQGSRRKISGSLGQCFQPTKNSLHQIPSLERQRLEMACLSFQMRMVQIEGKPSRCKHSVSLRNVLTCKCDRLFPYPHLLPGETLHLQQKRYRGEEEEPRPVRSADKPIYSLMRLSL